jgi:SNF2 family DNA or RNA helicase
MMALDYVPRSYQPQITQLVADVPRCSVWAGLGTGKTVSTLSAVDALILGGQLQDPTLVLAPLRVARDTWAKETAKWTHLRDMTTVPMIGTKAEREAALARILKGNDPLATINYDNIPWLIEQLGSRWPFGMVIADESTRLKGFRGGYRTHPKTGKVFYQGAGGQRTRMLGRVAHRSKRFVNLTGTPASNGLQDLWGQQWFVDRGARLGSTFDAYTQRWFRPKPNGFGVEPLPHAEAEIHERLSDVCLTVDIRDYYDVREPIRNRVEVELPPKAMAIYRDMERKMFAEIAGHEVEAVHAASRTIKCLQIANGAAFVDEKSTQWEEVHRAKIEALDSIIEEANGAPVLVAYHFKPDRHRLLKTFGGAIDLSTTAGLRAAMAGEGRVWLAHPASLGHGVDGLQEHCNQIAFFGHWWSLEERQQIIERVGPTRQMQAGKDRPVFVHDIVAAKTVDELVLERHETKKSVQDILLDAMKRKEKC